MITDTIATQLATERRRTLLAEADAYRLAKQAPAGGRPAGSSAALRTLTRRLAGVRALVRIRPIRPADAAVLKEGFSRLSAESRRMRFLWPKRELSAAELGYLTDIDHHDHEALVALSRIGGKGLGVARYVRNVEDPESAEVAITVIDEWQGQGLGTELMTRLTARASCEGIQRFTALTLVENTRVHKLLGKVGGVVTVVDRDSDTVTFEIALPPATARQPARWQLLRSAPADCAGSAR